MSNKNNAFSEKKGAHLSKIIGGTLLIVGTAIGGGMLALPVSASPGGFFNASLLLFGCWVLMTYSAFLILEINLWLPQNSNIISMAKATLGRKGEIIAWTSYLLLLYALICAYISSGTDIFHNLFQLIGINLPLWINSCLFVGVLGYVVYKGIESVDYVNRGLMTAKFAAYFLLVASVAPHIQLSNLQGGKASALIGSVTVMITSFGFASIIPSLRTYFNDDVKKLRLIITIGSLIPLLCYIIWILIILGVIPRNGSNSLDAVLHSGHSTTELTTSLSHFLNNPWITNFSRLFSSVCVATSFLGVSLGLSDFLADGFKIKKQGRGNVIIYAATFLPSLLIILFYPSIFILGISYAGIFCIILLALLPALMAYGGRYNKKIAHGYQVKGGKIALLILIVLISAIIVLSIKDSIS